MQDEFVWAFRPSSAGNRANLVVTTADGMSEVAAFEFRNLGEVAQLDRLNFDANGLKPGDDLLVTVTLNTPAPIGAVVTIAIETVLDGGGTDLPQVATAYSESLSGASPLEYLF